MVRQKSSVSVGSKAVPACCSICCRASLMGRDVRSGFSAVRSSNDLGDADNASEQGRAFFSQAKGVARSVPSLVMKGDNLHGVGG